MPAATGMGGDFFGTDYLGADPYHQQAADRLDRMTALDTLLRSQGAGASAPKGRVSAAVMPDSPRALGQPGMGAAGVPSQGDIFAPGSFNSISRPPEGTFGFGDPRAAMRGGGNMLYPQAPGRREGPGEGGGGPGGGGNTNPTPNPGDPGGGPPKDPCPGSGQWKQNPDGSWGCYPPGVDPPGTGGGAPPGGCQPGYYKGSDGNCYPKTTTGGPGGPGGTTTPGGAAGNWGSGGSGFLPPDLGPLRSSLQGFLLKYFQNAPKSYGGPLTVDPTRSMEQAFNFSNEAPGSAYNTLAPGRNAINSLLGFNYSPDISSIMGAGSAAMGAGGAAMGAGGSAIGAGNAAMGAGSGALGLVNPLMGLGNSAANAGAGALGLVNPMMGAGSAAMGAGNAAMGVGGSAIGAGNAAMRAGDVSMAGYGNAMDLASTGGVGNVSSALDAIRMKSMIDLDRQLADIREQYGAMGLGAGSDVATALSRGASEGIAGMNSAQQQLLANVMLSGAQNRLGGVNALTGMGSAGAGAFGTAGNTFGTAGNIYGTAGNMYGIGAGAIGGAGNLFGTAANAYGTGANAYGTAGNMYGIGSNAFGTAAGAYGTGANAYGTGAGAFGTAGNLFGAGLGLQSNAALGSAGIRSGAADLLPGFANAQTGAYQAGMGGMLGLAGLENQQQMYNNQALYNEFLRTLRPEEGGNSPIWNAALSYGTSYPPQPYPQGLGSGTMLGAAGLGAAGSILSQLPWATIFASDRVLKENIKPIGRGATKAALKRLAKLPISRWNYKGDSTPHIGPMAQDFSDAFGVGDGKNIHLVDVAGIMMTAAKAMAQGALHASA